MAARRMSVSEADWMRTVTTAARRLGWKVVRPGMNRRGSRTTMSGDGIGFPDLILVHESSDVLFAELKRDDGETSPEQDAWLARLKDRGVVWRPKDWPAVEARLKRRMSKAA